MRRNPVLPPIFYSGMDLSSDFYMDPSSVMEWPSSSDANPLNFSPYGSSCSDMNTLPNTFMHTSSSWDSTGSTDGLTDPDLTGYPSMADSLPPAFFLPRLQSPSLTDDLFVSGPICDVNSSHLDVACTSLSKEQPETEEQA